MGRIHVLRKWRGFGCDHSEKGGRGRGVIWREDAQSFLFPESFAGGVQPAASPTAGWKQSAVPFPLRKCGGEISRSAQTSGAGDDRSAHRVESVRLDLSANICGRSEISGSAPARSLRKQRKCRAVSADIEKRNKS